MSIEVETREAATDTYEQYRALSTAAVASLIVGLLSILAILDWPLVMIPVVGVVLASFAWLKVKRRSDELTGAGLAAAGLALSAFFLLAGPAWLSYVYLTEVPEGYARISYAELQPDPAEPGQLVPPEALELEGKKIFIKGFVYPGRQSEGIREFLLVRDRGDCCFGGDPKITDRILVKLDPPLTLTYAQRLHKLAGKFHVEVQQNAIDGARGGVFYHLQADHLQ
jgi:hypothetical protein